MTDRILERGPSDDDRPRYPLQQVSPTWWPQVLEDGKVTLGRMRWRYTETVPRRLHVLYGSGQAGYESPRKGRFSNALAAVINAALPAITSDAAFGHVTGLPEVKAAELPETQNQRMSEGSGVTVAVVIDQVIGVLYTATFDAGTRITHPGGQRDPYLGDQSYTVTRSLWDRVQGMLDADPFGVTVAEVTVRLGRELDDLANRLTQSIDAPADTESEKEALGMALGEPEPWEATGTREQGPSRGPLHDPVNPDHWSVQYGGTPVPATRDGVDQAWTIVRKAAKRACGWQATDLEVRDCTDKVWEKLTIRYGGLVEHITASGLRYEAYLRARRALQDEIYKTPEGLGVWFVNVDDLDETDLPDETGRVGLDPSGKWAMRHPEDAVVDAVTSEQILAGVRDDLRARTRPDRDRPTNEQILAADIAERIDLTTLSGLIHGGYGTRKAFTELAEQRASRLGLTWPGGNWNARSLPAAMRLVHDRLKAAAQAVWSHTVERLRTDYLAAGGDAPDASGIPRHDRDNPNYDQDKNDEEGGHR